MAISTTQVTQFSDSVAKALTDFNTTFVSGTAANTTSINNGIGGVGGSATLGRVMAASDLATELALLTKTNTVVSNVSAYLSGIRSLSSFYNQFLPYLDALDTLVGGLNAYLTTNTLTVNSLFASAFNYYASNAVGLGYRSTSNVPVSIAVANYFPYAAVDTMWNLTCSGATTFSTNAVGTNASTAVSGGGVAQLYIYKNNSGNAAGGATLTITYTNAAGAPVTATYSTVSGTPAASGSLASGYAVTGAIGSAVTAVTGTGMTNLEQYVLGMQLIRSAAY